MYERVKGRTAESYVLTGVSPTTITRNSTTGETGMHLYISKYLTETKKINKVAADRFSIVWIFIILTKPERNLDKSGDKARIETIYRVYSSETVDPTQSQREPGCASIPRNFVCKRLEVLNHLALLKWRGGGPASEGQEAMKTQPVTHTHSGSYTQSNSLVLETTAVLRHHGWPTSQKERGYSCCCTY